jgi:type III secretory pathway component EscV
MSTKNSTGRTPVLLSFSSAYTDLARRLADDLKAANIEVRYDKWEGGGGIPATQSLDHGVDDTAFVLPLLTPSNAARTWIGDEWRRTIYEEARARGVDVLPVRGDGDLHAIPDFLRDRSFADLCDREYALELRRLVETIRDRSGNPGIELPGDDREVHGTRPPMTLPANPLVLEAGESLGPLFEGDAGTRTFLSEMVPMMRDGLFYELGVQFPGISLRSGSDAPLSFVRIVINDIPETQVEVRSDSVMVNDSVAAMAERGFAAEPAINPATGAECAWLPAHKAAAARDCGLTTWDAYGFLILALSSVLRRKAADFIGIDETRAMLRQIEPVFPQLIAETVPKTVSLFVLTDVLRRLVAEGVSIRNLRRILMALANWGRVETDPLYLTEYVRAALQRQITHRLSRGTNKLVVFLLHPDIETLIRNATRHTATGSYVDLEPDRLREILNAIRAPMGALGDNIQVPQILTVMEIRSAIRRLVAPSLPGLHVVSYQELGPTTNIQPIGRISLDGFSPRTGVSVDGIPLRG